MGVRKEGKRGRQRARAREKASEVKLKKNKQKYVPHHKGTISTVTLPIKTHRKNLEKNLVPLPPHSET